MKETHAQVASVVVVGAVVLINFLTMPAMEYRGDAQAVRMEAISILRDGRWAVPDQVARRFGPRGNYFFQTNDGAWYPKFGILNTIVYLPFLPFEKLMKGAVSYDGDHVLVLNLLNILAAAAAAFYLYWLALRYTPSPRVGVIFVLASIYATFWWHYLRAHAFEAYMVPAVLGFFYHFLTNSPAGRQRNLIAAGLLLGSLCLIKTVFVIFVPIAFALLLYQERDRQDRRASRRSLLCFSVPVLVYSAWFFGGQIDWVISVARRTEHGILLALLVAGIVFGVKAWRRHKKRVASSSAVATHAPKAG